MASAATVWACRAPIYVHPPGLSHPVEPHDDQVRGLPGEPTFELGASPGLNTATLAADEPGVLSDGHGPKVIQDLPKI